MAKTNIGWTDESINPYGWICREISPGCAHCYAHALARKMGRDFYGKFYTRWPAAMKEVAAVKPGSVVFLNSMADTYFSEAGDREVYGVHNLALARPDVTWLILTKRPERAYHMRHVLAWPPNLWLGVSVENAGYLWRIDYALATPAAGVFISAEPLLGDIGTGLRAYVTPDGWPERHGDVPEDVYQAGRGRAVGWVIAGGESGPKRRPLDKNWVRNIRDTCAEFGAPFFYKQGSAYAPGRDRMLDGQTWSQLPAAFSRPANGQAGAVEMPPGQQLSLFELPARVVYE